MGPPIGAAYPIIGFSWAEGQVDVAEETPEVEAVVETVSVPSRMTDMSVLR
jgi:hypothetical protein